MRRVQLSPGASSWICTACASLLRTGNAPFKPPTPKHYSKASQTKKRLPETPARTRFAPSPTGSLHLGSIRTALFNYLLARRTGGQFLLRVEDTDQKRTVPGAEERLYHDLRWVGLDWDEGPTVGGAYGPYRQSQRNPIYEEHVRVLLAKGKAYRCFCTAERIDKLNRSRHDRGLPLGYDRHCSDLPADVADEKARRGEAHVIRFRAPEAYPPFDDVSYGMIGQGHAKVRRLHLEEAVYDDPVLVKSDGFPTYHMANVVDDRLMKITHVIRGSEWMSSTPLHVALYEAFGWDPPAFAHVPLLVDKNGQKLSKRNFTSDVATFQKQGVFADALINFAALLGWSHQRKTDVMRMQDLEESFDLKITKGNTIVAFEKLHFLQQQHAQRKIADRGEEFEQMIREVALALLEQYGTATITDFVGQRKLRDVIASLLRAESLQYQSAAAFASQCSIFLVPLHNRSLFQPSDVSWLKPLRTAGAALCLVPDSGWNADIHRANMALVQSGVDVEDDARSLKEWRKEFYRYLRWALLGGAAGPSLPQAMEILGRTICVERLQSAALMARDMETAATRPHVQRAMAEA